MLLKITQNRRRLLQMFRINNKGEDLDPIML